jgi:Kelch motif/Galactose oxidase, central domain
MKQARQAVFGKAFLWVMLAALGLASCGGGGGYSPPGKGQSTPPPVTLESISVTPTPGTPTPFTGGVGFGRQMIATGTYSDGTTADLTSTAVWSSSSTSIATVSAGVVSGVALETATITTTSAGVAGSGSITITSGSWVLSLTFTYQGNLVSMTGPTVTALADGSVLVRGDDRGGEGPFASGEYSFLPDSWTPAGEEVVERGGHTATLLQNGKVLVTGGTLDINPLASCELYDPTSKIWSAAASLPQGREQHAAVLLTDGRVLVVGRSTEGTLIPDADVYDPTTNTWSDAGAMLNPSMYPTATLLANGTVFVMDGDATGTTEIYDPTTNSWSAGPTAGNAHEDGATATTLTDGRILIVGGNSGVSINPITLAYPEIYDPVAGTWSAAGTMNQNRVSPVAVRLLNGTVLVAGGVTQTGLEGPISSAEIYDPGTNTWTLTGSLNFPSAGGAAVLLPGGQVFMVAGDQSTMAELYW